METLKGLLFACVVIAIGYAISRLFSRRKRYLMKNGIRGVAKVVNIERTGADVSSSTELARPVFEIDLQVENSEQQPLVTIRHAFAAGAAIPGPGDRIYVLIDPRNPDNLMIAPD